MALDPIQMGCICSTFQATLLSATYLCSVFVCAVFQALAFIFKSLGVKCVTYLKQVCFLVGHFCSFHILLAGVGNDGLTTVFEQFAVVKTTFP